MTPTFLYAGSDFVSDLVPSEIACLASSQGSLMVWKPSREGIADEAVEDSALYEVPRHEMTPA